jgi:acyl carrier protein
VENRVKAIMADIFMMDVSSIDKHASMNTISKWDSLAQIDLISALEEEFGVTFEVEEFELMTSLRDVIDRLSTKL